MKPNRVKLNAEYGNRFLYFVTVTRRDYEDVPYKVNILRDTWLAEFFWRLFWMFKTGV